MKTLSYLFLVLAASFSFCLNSYSQELTTEQKAKITAEITIAFDKSLEAAEKLDANLLADCVDDDMRAGFIINGYFFQLFDEVMKDFDKNARGCKSQKMNITNKKITVLGEDIALLVTSGDYSLFLEDGRTLTGKFAWTIVYSKVNGKWKIIHTHM